MAMSGNDRGRHTKRVTRRSCTDGSNEPCHRIAGDKVDSIRRMSDNLEDLFAETAQEDIPVVDDRDAASKALVEQLLTARALRDEKETLESRVKEINKSLDETPEPVILKQFDAPGIGNMRVQGVGLVYKSETDIPTILDNDKFLEWIDGAGDGGIAKRTVHYQTMKAWYKDRKANGTTTYRRSK